MGLQHADKGGAAKPEWWNDEELKALSARVVRAAPDDAWGCQRYAGWC